VITGSLVMTAQVSDMTYGRVDTMVTLEVTDDRPVAPGQHWYPREASPHRM
jgi:urease beta subunit